MTLIMLLTIRLSGRKEENIPLICKRAHIIPYCKASSDEVKNLGHPQKHHSYLLSMWRPVKVKVLVAQLHPTLLPHGLCGVWNSLSMEFSRQEYWSEVSSPWGSSWPKDQIQVSCTKLSVYIPLNITLYWKVGCGVPNIWNNQLVLFPSKV